MAVMLSIIEEMRIESAGDDEGGDVKKQFGIEEPIHDGDSLNSSSPNDKESNFNKLSRSNKVSTKIATNTSSMESSPRPSSSNFKDTLTISQEDKLESTKVEMGEAYKENERLKTTLARIVKDYQSLQIQFINMVQQEQAKTPVEAPPIRPDVEERELISLSLGTSASGQKRGEKISTTKSKENDETEKGLALGLDCKYEGSSGNPDEPSSNPSPENSFKEPKEQEAGEPWPPSKILKNLRNGDDEVSQQTHVKRARVSVRARCDAPTMNDGCQWRKYGQKISKGNPCPRAYYRCTVAPACPVRKQVQRCAEDMSILITTYEGNHNHPLPISATAIASTTSAAACMLMSGSSTSRSAIGSLASSSTTAATIASMNANPDGSNFGLSDNSRVRQLYLSNPTITSSPYNPTITLDLTATPSSTTQPSQFNRFSSNFNSNQRHSTGFNYSILESNAIPASWGNGYLNYGTQSYNMSHTGSLSLRRQSQDPFYQSYLKKVINPAPAAPTQNSLTDSIAKAITSDSSFQSALAAAITSYVGAHVTQGGVESLSQNLKLEEQVNSVASYTVASTSNGCATSYLTTSTSSSSNPKQGNFLYLQPPLSLSSKSASASPVDNRENIS